MTLPTSRFGIRTVMTLISLAVAAGGLSAQAGPEAAPGKAPSRHGVHFSVGLGSASVSASCPSCEIDFAKDRINGFSGRLQLGAVVTPQLIVAGEFTGWIKNDATLNRRIAALSVVLLGYPSASAGFFVKGGFGVLRAVVEDNVVAVRSDALMASSGIGYDFPVGDRAMLTGYATYIRTFSTQTWANGIISPVPISPNAIQVGVAITVH